MLDLSTVEKTDFTSPRSSLWLLADFRYLFARKKIMDGRKVCSKINIK